MTAMPSVSLEKRARQAAFSSFIGAVVDWYDFLLYGIVAALVLKPNFSQALAQLWEHWQPLQHLGWAFSFAL